MPRAATGATREGTRTALAASEENHGYHMPWWDTLPIDAALSAGAAAAVDGTQT